MTPVLSTEHNTYRKSAPPPVAVAVLTDDIVVGFPMPEVWKDLKYSDLLDTVRIANPDTHIRKVEIANGGLTLRVYV